ncbi:MAG: hypothetical protein ACOH2V_01025 [Candidatus Saccharimonadaceae bacterium]
METYRFKLLIGDSGGDGHNMTMVIFVESNKPLAEVQRLYIQACNKFGFELDDMGNGEALCSAYQDTHIPTTFTHKLADFGLILDKDIWRSLEVTNCLDEPDRFAEIVLAFIRTQDPELVLTIVDDNIPNFSDRVDVSNRWIGNFGYGLFE